MPELTQKKKIAILGGGVGSMSTAFEITNKPGWSEEYDITIYQMGWRLGGKGASGRDRAFKDRICEHGLHVWEGFYENAFRLINAAYAEWVDKNYQPQPLFKSGPEAFEVCNIGPIMDPSSGDWQIQPLEFQPTAGQPGVGEPAEALDFWDLVLRANLLLVSAYLGASWQTGLSGWLLRMTGKIILAVSDWIEKHPWLEALVAWLLDRVSGGLLLILSFALAHGAQGHPDREEKLASCHSRFLNWFRAHPAKDTHPDEFHIILTAADTLFAIVRGVIEDRITLDNYADFDETDFMEWLTNHGCVQPWNVFTRLIYDGTFSYRQGRNEYQPNLPGPQRIGLNLAAGSGLYGVLRAVGTYKQGFFFKMRAGMGDTIFSPLYVVLKNRGVKFKFFHKVLNLSLSADRSRVETIAMEVQAKVKPERKEAGYDPIYTVKGVPSWPSEPFWDQLQDAGELRKLPNLETYWNGGIHGEVRTFRLGEDFDSVVLGIAVGALPYICPELVADNPRWRNMVDRVETVKTQAVQLWMHRTQKEVGFPEAQPLVLTGFTEPHDTWANMDHLIPRESWTPEDNIRQIAYFCNVAPECAMPDCSVQCLPHRRIPGCPAAPPFTDTQFPIEQTELAKQAGLRFLNESMPILWPKFRWDDVVGGSFDKQFWRINVDPTERYVLAVAGSTKYRLKAWDSGYKNLVLTGDWTYNPLSLGCVEASVMSGLMASYAVCGYPETWHGPMGQVQRIADIQYPKQARAAGAG